MTISHFERYLSVVVGYEDKRRGQRHCQVLSSTIAFGLQGSSWVHPARLLLQSRDSSCRDGRLVILVITKLSRWLSAWDIYSPRDNGQAWSGGVYIYM
jgi:hypothetical protein